MASLWKLPVIYLCENNGYAITTSLAQSHAQTDITKRAAGYAMPSVSVDGQNVLAVYEASHEAVARARRGEGPTLIEAKTYRFEDHEIGLVIPGKPYRSAEEVAEHRANRDPVVLFRQALLTDGMSDAQLDAIESEVVAAVAEAIEFGKRSPLPDPTRIYDHMYSNPIMFPPQHVAKIQ